MTPVSEEHAASIFRVEKLSVLVEAEVTEKGDKWVNTSLYHYSAKAQKTTLWTILLSFMKHAQHNE